MTQSKSCGRYSEASYVSKFRHKREIEDLRYLALEQFYLMATPFVELTFTSTLHDIHFAVWHMFSIAQINDIVGYDRATNFIDKLN